MLWTDFSQIVFGAILGFGISILLDRVRNYQTRTSAFRILSAEVETLLSTLETFSTDNKPSWPVTEIPSLTPMGLPTLGVLPKDIAKNIVSIQWSIKQANELRLLAIDAARNDSKEEKNVYAYGCIHWIDNARETSERLKENIGNR